MASARSGWSVTIPSNPILDSLNLRNLVDVNNARRNLAPCSPTNASVIHSLDSPNRTTTSISFASSTSRVPSFSRLASNRILEPKPQTQYRPEHGARMRKQACLEGNRVFTALYRGASPSSLISTISSSPLASRASINHRYTFPS